MQEGWRGAANSRRSVPGATAGDLDWVNRAKCTVQPLATFQQPLHLSGDIQKIENVAFILASGWSPSPFPAFYEEAKTKGWRTVAMGVRPMT